MFNIILILYIDFYTKLKKLIGGFLRIDNLVVLTVVIFLFLTF